MVTRLEGGAWAAMGEKGEGIKKYKLPFIKTARGM